MVGGAEGLRDVTTLVKEAQSAVAEPRQRRDAVEELGRHQTAEAAKALLLLAEDAAARSMAQRVFREQRHPAAVKVAAGALKDGSPAARVLACQVLGEAGGSDLLPALDSLARQAKEPEVRGAAVEAAAAVAARSGNPADAGSFIKLIDLPETESKALQSLYRFRDPRSAPGLHPLLSHGKPEVRLKACRQVGKLKNALSVDHLLKMVATDKAKQTRACAITTAVEVAPPARAKDVAKALVALFDDEEWSKPASAAVAKIRSPEAGPVLVPALSSAKPEVRRSVAAALGEMGYADAADTLAKMAAEDADNSVRRHAREALAKVARSEAHVAVLFQRPDGKERERAELVEALRHVRQPDVAPLLFPLLKHQDWVVRAATCRALGELANPKAGVVLLDAAERDEEHQVKAAAAEALKLAGPPEVLPRMERLLDTGPNLRVTALAHAFVAIDRTARFERTMAAVQAGKPVGRVLVLALINSPHPSDEKVFAAALTHKDPINRMEAMTGMAGMRSASARETMCRFLASDPDFRVRDAAVQGLGHFRDEPTAECLVSVLQKLDRRRDITLYESTLRSLRALSGQNLGEDVAAWVTWRKGGMGLGSGQEAWLKGLSQDDGTLRALAARQLAKTPDGRKAAVAKAVAMVAEEPSGDARVALIELLGAAGDRAAVEPLLTLVEKRPREMAERVALARALDGLGDGRGTLSLVEDLDSEDGSVRARAVQALSEVTGEPPHPQPAFWKGWWREQAERYRR
jgi:HEAT repeat protein